MLELSKQLYYIGVQDEPLRVFDIVMHTPYGTSYNAYLINGTEKSALVETVKLGFSDTYFKAIEEIMPISDIDYLIINHTEPDHAGTIPLLLEKNPGLTLVGTNSALTFVAQIINRDFSSKAVKKGDELDLGGRVLQFHPMPNLHWPDTMFTFDTLSKSLFTCDAFGAHYAFDAVLFSKMKDKNEYISAQHQYFLDILSPFIRPFMVNGLQAAKALNPTMILTGHGPVLDADLDQLFERYDTWCAPQPKNGKSVAIAYVSSYGYTKALAQVISETLKAKQVEVDMFDLLQKPACDAVCAILNADGFLLGTPTILGDALEPVVALAASIHPIQVKGKLASAFGSYGWSGEGVPFVMERLNQLKVKTIEGYRARLKPSDAELQGAKDFATRFAEAL